ncbi:MAG: ABC-type transport auxiliary lipoprotein family protein [Pseudomonadota bacterium]
MSGILRVWVLIGLALAAGACTVLPESQPLEVFALPASELEHTAAAAAGAGRHLRIDAPGASGLLRSDRILVAHRDNRLSVYAGARWSAQVPTLWRDHLVDAFSGAAGFASVTSDAANLQADRVLGGTLRAFQVNDAGPSPAVEIRLDARLIDPGSRRVLAARRLSVREPAGGRSVENAVRAFGRAGDRLAEQLVSWTLEQWESEGRSRNGQK